MPTMNQYTPIEGAFRVPSHIAGTASPYRTKDSEYNVTLMRSYESSQSAWAERSRGWANYVHNNQFAPADEAALRKRNQAAIPINVIYPAVEQAVAMLTTNQPQFQATAREDSDKRTAKLVTDVLSYIWDLSVGNSQLKEAIWDAYVRGRGVLCAYIDPNSDYGRGDIKINCLNPHDVFPDPHSQDRLWRDAAHVLHRRFYSRSQLIHMMPDCEAILPYASSLNSMQVNRSMTGAVDTAASLLLGDGDEFYEVIERHSKVKSVVNHVYDTTSSQELAFTEDELIEWFKEPAWHVSDGQQEYFITIDERFEAFAQLYDQGQPTEGRTRVFQAPPDEEGNQAAPLAITPTTIFEVYQNELITIRQVRVDRIRLVISLGDQEYFNKILPISNYPIVPLNNRHDRDPYPLSDVAIVQPIQDSINKINMQILANIASINGNKIIVNRNSVDRDLVENQLSIVGPSVIEVDYEMGEPKILGGGSFPAGLFQHFENMKRQVQAELGIFDSMGGDASSAPNTYKGTLAIDEFGQRRIRSKIDDVEFTLNMLGKVIVEMIPMVYTEERTFRIVQSNNKVRETVANQLIYDDLTHEVKRINDLTMLQADVKVVSGSTLPSHRWARAEYMQEMFQIGAIDQVEFLKNSEIIDADGVLERVGYIRQLEGQIQQMQELLKEERAKRLTAETNELTAKKQSSVERIKAEERVAKVAIMKGAELHTQRMGDQVKLANQQSTTPND